MFLENGKDGVKSIVDFFEDSRQTRKKNLKLLWPPLIQQPSFDRELNKQTPCGSNLTWRSVNQIAHPQLKYPDPKMVSMKMDKVVWENSASI